MSARRKDLGVRSPNQNHLEPDLSYSVDESIEDSSKSSENNTGYTSNISTQISSDNESLIGYYFDPDASGDERSESWNEDSDGESSTESDGDHSSSFGHEDYPDEFNQDSNYDSDDDETPWLSLSLKLVTAVKLDRLASVLNTTEDGAGVSCRRDNNVSALHHAVRWGNDMVVSALLMAGIDSNLLYNGRSALMMAVVDNEQIMASVLLDAGANVDFRYQGSTRKRTLLHRAVQLKRGRAMIELLLDHGADVNAKDDLGESVLCCAANTEYIKINPKVNRYHYADSLELLISRGAYVLHDGPKGEDSSFEAVLQYGPLEALKLFFNNGVRLENCRDRPLLHVAVKNPFQEVIEFLLDSRILDIEMKNSAGRTVLLEAIADPSNPRIELLLRYGANPNSFDETGQSPLLVALRLHRGKAVQQLFEFGARLDPKTLGLIESNRKLHKSPCLHHVVAQLALIEGQDCDIDADARQLIDVCELEYFYKICQKEVLSLKDSVIHDQLTYYRLLVSENIYRLVDNELIKNTMEDLDFVVKKFYVYGNRIIRHFIRLQEKLGAMKGLGRLIKIDIHAFHHIYHNILHHLRYVDLQNLNRV